MNIVQMTFIKNKFYVFHDDFFLCIEMYYECRRITYAVIMASFMVHSTYKTSLTFFFLLFTLYFRVGDFHVATDFFNLIVVKKNDEFFFSSLA